MNRLDEPGTWRYRALAWALHYMIKAAIVVGLGAPTVVLVAGIYALLER